MESGVVKGYSKRLWKKAFMEEKVCDCIRFKCGTCMVALKWDKKKELKVFFFFMLAHLSYENQATTKS